jgi:hypothetical protein
MQLKQELHNLQKNKMNINDYSTKVKNLADALASIGAPRRNKFFTDENSHSKASN